MATAPREVGLITLIASSFQPGALLPKNASLWHEASINVAQFRASGDYENLDRLWPSLIDNLN